MADMSTKYQDCLSPCAVHGEHNETSGRWFRMSGSFTKHAFFAVCKKHAHFYETSKDFVEVNNTGHLLLKPIKEEKTMKLKIKGNKEKPEVTTELFLEQIGNDIYLKAVTIGLDSFKEEWNIMKFTNKNGKLASQRIVGLNSEYFVLDGKDTVIGN